MEPFTFLTPTASADGYGVAGEMMARAAVEHYGADIRVIGHDWRDERFSDPSFLAMKVHPSLADDRRTIVDFFLPYALARFRAERTLSMTMWESDRLPDGWASILDRMADGVIVPSAHCASVFADRISVPIEVVPLGTDVDFYSYRRREPMEIFTFLMAGLLHWRKGLEFALRALREEFAEDEPVRLVLKTRLGFLDAGDEWRTLADPRVLIIDEDFSRERMRDLYHAVDAFVAPSRGEGSGLTPRDAMATGLPTIVTDWGGLAELADPYYSWPIPVEDMEDAPDECSSYGRGVVGPGPIGRFARPSVRHIREAMRAMFEDRERARCRGIAASCWVRRRWTWKRCAGDWLGAVEKLSNVTEEARC